MKKNVLFIGISVSLLILLGIGVSYSMWNMSNTQDTENVISVSDCFDIVITSQENSISLKNSYPISDEKGKSLTPFTFKVTNTCDIAASYSVNLESLKGSTLSSSFLKIMVNNKVPKMLNQYDNVSTVNNGSVEARVLDTGILFKNKSKTYEIRLWIDYDTTMEDLDNETKILKSKIVVTGSPTNEEEPSPTLLTDTVKSVANDDTVDIATDDPDNNIRYIGKEPYNYVYFNCSDYSNQSDSTCEKWRIIGLFNNITKGDGSKENLVKIIRDDGIGSYSWDTNENYGTNDWTISDLMKLLNDGYDSETVGGSLYWNAKNGTCYVNSNNEVTQCNFTTSGFKNDTTRNAVASVVWNLGGSSTYNDVTPSIFYERERGSAAYGNNPTTWTGKIGLMYPSDYGYATGNISVLNREICLSSPMNSWNSSDLSFCKNNNYLYKKRNQWFLTSSLLSDINVLRILYDGKVDVAGSYGPHEVLPTLYLKSDITVIDGNGSSNSPYQLGL